MFNPTRLLGSLVVGGLRNEIGPVTGAALGMGALAEEERRRIQEKLRDAALSDAERAFAGREFLSPATIEQLAAEVDSPECAEELYAASRLAVKLDNDAERRHLAALAARLGLAPEATGRIDAALDAAATR